MTQDQATRERSLNEIARDAIDQITTTAEEIHCTIGAAPITLLERLGLLSGSAADLRALHRDAVGVVYEAVREVNHRVADLADDLPRSSDDRPRHSVRIASAES